MITKILRMKFIIHQDQSLGHTTQNIFFILKEIRTIGQDKYIDIKLEQMKRKIY